MSSGLQQALQQAWREGGPLARLLWPLSLLYGALVILRRGLYQLGVLSSHPMRVPVVVVGNVVAGGAGKTPVVMAIVRHLLSQGRRPGVVSRGYGRQGSDCREVLADASAQDVGDEPLLIQRVTGVPVFVAPYRTDAALALLAQHPLVDVIICDDGLQHLALRRDVEICVFDDSGTGNGWLLPAGPLREPWPRAVDLVLHSGGQPAFAGYTAQRRLAGHAKRADGQRRPLAELASNAPLLAVAAIARPESFFDMLRAEGLTLAQTQALPDHFDFAEWQTPQDRAYTLLCTEKDAVKLWASQPDAWAVPLEFTPEPAFLRALDERLGQLSSPHGHTTS
jgi:tetraacyldisaccharide 4'-kinase